MTDLSQTFERACERYSAGDWSEAERLCREILDLLPDQADTLNLLGAVLLRQERSAEAIESLARAADLAPDEARFHANHGHALKAAGREREAAQAFARALLRAHATGLPWKDVGSLADLIRERTPDARAEAAALVADGLAWTDPVRRFSLLFHLTGDLRHYRALVEAVLANPPGPAALRHIYWGITFKLQEDAAGIGNAEAFWSGPLNTLWKRLVDETASLLGPAPARTEPGKAVKRIAVVTNQMLGEGHQPTIDVLGLAHRIHAEHDIETLIVNANALPTGTGSAFVPEYAFNVAEEYLGTLRLQEGEMSARMVSHPGRFDRETVAAVMASIDGFDPDAVIAYGGDNLYGDLAARTRPVVCLSTTPGFVHSQAALVVTGDRSAGVTRLIERCREAVSLFSFSEMVR